MRKNNFIQIMSLIVAGAGIPFFVLWGNVFPTISLDYMQKNEFGFGFIPQKIDDKVWLVVSPGMQYPFNSTDLSLQFSKQSADIGKVTVTLAKDFLANVFPTGQAIIDQSDLEQLIYQDNPTGIPNGALYSHADSVLVVSQGKYYPILSPTVFENMGYHWEQVVPIDNQSYAQLAEGDKINQLSAHPDGTILKTKDGQYFILWDGMKRPVSDELLAKVWKSFYWVDVDSDQVKPLAKCETSLDDQELDCQFSYDKEQLNTPGKVFLLSLDAPVADNIESGRISFSTDVTSDQSYLQFALGQIKAKLFTRYVGYFL